MYEIQHLMWSGWENTTTDDQGKKVTFDTREEAEQELAEHLADLKEAAENGDMLPYDESEFRVAEVQEECLYAEET